MTDIRVVAETGSTNDDVAALAREGAAEGVWIRAGRQTGGRGRQGREWISPPGNLYASTLVRLRPGDPPAPTLALVSVVALQRTATEFVPPDVAVRVKWPNDLLIAGAKLSGILLERIGDSIVVGFGVNLAHHPEGAAVAATDLATLGEAPDPALFLERLAAIFPLWLARWRNEGLAPIREAWLAAAYPLGTSLSTHVSSGDRIEGGFGGLDDSGALRLILPDGSSRLIHAGDVFLL